MRKHGRDVAQHGITCSVPERVIDGLEEIKIHMHQAKGACALIRKHVVQGKVESAPVAQPGQRVGAGLLLCLVLGAAQANVQGSQLFHDHRFRLDDIEQLNRKIGGGEIRLCQTVSSNRLDYPWPEGQVHKRPVLCIRHSDASKGPLRPARPEKQPLSRAGP